MDERRQSSAVFSLNELMVEERHRATRERAEAERRALSEDRAAAERERVENARRAADAAERKARDARERLEQDARASAIMSAEIERARVETEARMRAELLEAEHAHRQRLAEIRETRSRRFHRGLSVASVVIAVLTSASAVALYFSKLDIERDYRDHLAAASARIARAERELDREKARARSQPATPSAPPPAAGATPPATAEPTVRGSRPKSSPGPESPAEHRARCKNSGDPLDGCL